jgi:hypothetical protein
VMADCMQIAPNHWVHLQRKDGRNISISISGVTYTDAEPTQVGDSDPACPSDIPHTTPTRSHTTFELTLQQRWHAIGKDLGWRPVDCHPIPNCTPVQMQNGVNVWRYDLHLPHSASTHKYRLLIEEFEWLLADGAAVGSPVSSPRLVYADFFEL